MPVFLIWIALALLVVEALLMLSVARSPLRTVSSGRVRADDGGSGPNTPRKVR